ncbi:hypothetical protein HYH03_005816 [Edaphochlamys debaryana]|uniref:Uncharacterized protein n=1 Tax=Edaphochlamys debaryana TaxID=47281 RepID=A0A835Y585_9CHLO|nr:hypothetical protein HYH03_005816 [Edaphochlamys debaryana]|eukprot:KAG2496218.1 hypothetical protein HYH03_005816 [Edaphochlamys debaryana]
MAEPVLKRQRIFIPGEEIELNEVQSAAEIDAAVVVNVAVLTQRALSAKAHNRDAIPDETIVELLKKKSLVTNIISGATTLADIHNQLKDLAATQEGFKALVSKEMAAAKEQIMAHVDEKVAGLTRLLGACSANSRARLHNNSALGACKLLAVQKEKEPTSASPDAVGTVPPDDLLPETAEAVGRLTQDEVSALERFYGEEFAGDGLLGRCRAVGAFLGMRVVGL